MKSLHSYNIISKLIVHSVVAFYVVFFVGCSVIVYNSGTVQGKSYEVLKFEKGK